MIYIGIDPGASGGIAAVEDVGGVVLTVPMPATDQDVLAVLVDLVLQSAHFGEKVVAVLERVWSSPGWGHVGAFKFGMSLGALRMALTAAKIPFDLVLPRVWQKDLSVTYPAKATTTVKKNLTKARAQQLYPGVRLTHATADALLLAEHCRRTFTRRREYGKEDEGRPRTPQGNRRGPRPRPAREVPQAAGAPVDGAGPALKARRPVRVDRGRARAGEPRTH
jgi:hypothetical protein